ncbi:hypothetical protein ScPMuIL_004056 [Solemya velum]
MESKSEKLHTKKADSGENVEWNRNIQASVLSRLPSHRAFNSDCGTTLSRTFSRSRHRSSFASRSGQEIVSGIPSDDLLDKLGFPAEPVDTSDVFLNEQPSVLNHQSIRSMTACMSVKRYYRDQRYGRGTERLDSYSRLKQRQQLAWQRFKDGIKNTLYQLELWAGAFKIIEGRFGTATMSYFKFIRWLLFLNVFMSIVMICVVLVPHFVINAPSTFAGSVNVSTSVFHYEAAVCTNVYNNATQELIRKESMFQKVLDFLQGTGWMEPTVLFYGVFYNQTYGGVDSGEDMQTFNMSLAYILSTGAIFLFSLIFIIRNSAKGVKAGIISSDSSLTQYSNKVFGGWDFCISDGKAAHLKHISIFQELQGDLQNQALQWKLARRTFRQRFRLYVIRFISNLFVIVLLGGALYLIWYTNEQMVVLQTNLADQVAVVQFFIQFLPSVTITVLNVIIPIICQKIVVIEDHVPAVEIKLTLLRTVFLRLASLGIMLLSLRQLLEGTGSSDANIIPGCGNKHWLINSTDEGSGSIKCWETYVGQQLYKLVVLDFFVVVIVTFVVEFPRKIIYKRFHEKVKLVKLVGQQEFDLPKSVLDIVYGQALCWIGFFFSPLIPAICVVKFLVFFYLSLLNNCIPKSRQYQTSRSNSLFMSVLLLSLLLAVLPLLYVIMRMQPSQSCGPFRLYSVPEFVFFTSVTNTIGSWPSQVQDVIFFLGTAGFLAPAIVICVLVMVYFIVVAQAQEKMEEILQEQLVLEGRDKQFLLARVNEVLMMFGDMKKSETDVVLKQDFIL